MIQFRHIRRAETRLLRKAWNPHVKPGFENGRRSAFSLLELLTVISIIAVMMVLVVPAVGSIKGAGDVTKAAYAISGVLEQARTYAMSQNTYVYVGLQEVDANSPTSSTPVGRVVVAAVASMSGQRPTNAAAETVAISKVLLVDGAHITNVASLGSTGNMQRPGPAVDLGQSVAAGGYQFVWPLGATPGSARYNFTKAAEFDPQGVARVPTNAAAQALQPYIEIGLVPAHGNTAPASSNQAVIQISGITGAARIFRP